MRYRYPLMIAVMVAAFAVVFALGLLPSPGEALFGVSTQMLGFAFVFVGAMGTMMFMGYAFMAGDYPKSRTESGGTVQDRLVEETREILDYLNVHRHIQDRRRILNDLQTAREAIEADDYARADRALRDIEDRLQQPGHRRGQRRRGRGQGRG